MKKIVILLLLLGSNISVFAQTDFLVRITNLTYRIEKGVKNDTSSNIHIEVVYTDGKKETLYYRDIKNEGDAENNWFMKKFLNTRGKVPKRISVYAFVNFRTGTDANETKFIDFGKPCTPTSQSFSGYYSPRMTNIDFKYTIQPIIKVEEPSYRIIGYEDPLTLKANPDFDNSFYNWQYATTFSTFSVPPNPPVRFYQWKPIPVTNGSTVSVTPKDFVEEEFIGKDIYFAIKTCPPSGGFNIENTNIISYRLTKSAPNISSITSTSPKCYDGSDGTITIQFDRPLDSGDNLSIAVGDKSVEIGGVDENDRPNLQSVPVTGGNNVSLDANNRVTLTDVPPSKTEYRVDIYGSYNGTAYFTGGSGHSKPIKVIRRPEVAFKTKPKDGITPVFCHGGDDGKVVFTAEGGVGGYQYLIKEVSEAWSNDWQPFPPRSNTATISNLTEGTYQIKIKDRFDCVAKIKKGDVLGEDIVEQVTITEPKAPLKIEFDTLRSKDPRAFGFTDGVIVAKVTGSTPNSGTYNFKWENEARTELTNVDTRVLTAPDVGFELTLNGVPKGKYYLTVWDRNHSGADYKTTCIVEDAFYELDEPDPLVLTFEESHSISCNNTNQYGDESSDGELIVHAKGGIQLQPTDNLGLPYYYTWKKQNTDTGVWDELSL